jgi:hypothetical protein
MIVVAFLGANFGAMRLLLSRTHSRQSEVTGSLLVGFLPLADAMIVALFVVVSRYRVMVRRTSPSRRRRMAPRFAGLCGLLLLASIVSCVSLPDLLIEYIELSAAPAERGLKAIGVDTSVDTPLLRYVLLPTFLGILLSGPPLVVASALTWLTSRFTVAITPRTTKEDSPCDGSAS